MTYDCYRLGVTFVCCRHKASFIYVRAIQTSKVYPINDKNQINDSQYAVEFET